MAFAAKLQEFVRVPSVRPEGKCEFAAGGVPPRRHHVGPSGSVATLTGHVGNHRSLIEPLIIASRELRRMATEAIAGCPGRRQAAVGSDAWRGWLHVVTRSERQHALLCIKGEPMLENRRDLRVRSR